VVLDSEKKVEKVSLGPKVVAARGGEMRAEADEGAAFVRARLKRKKEKELWCDAI